ncbi:MAG: helix-hairpin-helix domain-containing protein [Deltaproteobacteria bacterium]|nr:helix-hairpin-helix domain-containing protein [Deltaproteobacteria bacterium]
MGREGTLAALAAALVGLAAIRMIPARAEARPLPCAPAEVGKSDGIAQCAAPGALTGGERRVLGLPLDVNQATEAELDALPGIGAQLAQRIVAERKAHGPFANLEALERVPGIGPGKLRLLAGRATARAEHP